MRIAHPVTDFTVRKNKALTNENIKRTFVCSRQGEKLLTKTACLFASAVAHAVTAMLPVTRAPLITQTAPVDNKQFVESFSICRRAQPRNCNSRGSSPVSSKQNHLCSSRNSHKNTLNGSSIMRVLSAEHGGQQYLSFLPKDLHNRFCHTTMFSTTLSK